MLGPIAWRTPPSHYGPWERVTSLLTEGLVARGLDVTLFATADSQTAGRLDAVSPHGYAEDPTMDGRVWEALHVAHALSRSGEFDLVHNQLDWLPLAFSQHCAAPMVTTVHGFSGPTILPAYLRARSAFVAISDADRSPALDYVATIGHGVDFTELPLQRAPLQREPSQREPSQPATLQTRAAGGLVAFGRIHPDKGTAQAIEIARRAGRRLVICGIVQDARYFAEQVEPHIDGDRVVYLGSVGPTARAQVLGAAAVLLHPIAFPEPFGLSVVEAMACGTPVVAYRRGSMSEVVDEGVTGYLIDVESNRTVDEAIDAAVAAIGPASRLDRTAVRARAEQRFGVDRMVADYLRVYEQLLAR